MKKIQLLITSLLFCIFQIFNFGFENKAQAKRNEILDLNNFLGSSERRHIQDLKDAEVKRRDLTASIDNEHAEFARRRRQKQYKKLSKNRKITSKKSLKLAGKHKKRTKGRKGKSNRRYFETKLNQIDRDSKMSDSKDSDIKGKPVDIIVHIKMND